VGQSQRRRASGKDSSPGGTQDSKRGLDGGPRAALSHRPQPRPRCNGGLWGKIDKRRSRKTYASRQKNVIDIGNLPENFLRETLSVPEPGKIEPVRGRMGDRASDSTIREVTNKVATCVHTKKRKKKKGKKIAVERQGGKGCKMVKSTDARKVREPTLRDDEQLVGNGAESTPTTKGLPH